MSERKQRPGFILYLDTICPALERLSDAQCGRLLRGIVDYVQTGALPELDDAADMVFYLLRPGLDRDGERYEKRRLHTKYMAYCKELKIRGETPLSEDAYTQLLTETDSNCQLPTTDPTTTATPIPTANTTPAAEGEGKGKAEGCKGEKRGRTVYEPLSEADFESMRQTRIEMLG